MNCSIAQTLEVLGDWWTLLIVREAFMGTQSFGDMQQNLGIAKNILSNRLANLVDNGVFEKVDKGQQGVRFVYRLTDKGRDLYILVTAMRQWADKWVYGEGNEPLLVRDKENGEKVAPLQLTNDQGQPLTYRDVFIQPGPGAEAATVERFAQAKSARLNKPVSG